MKLDDIDKRLIDDLQKEVPLVERPFQAIAEQLGLTESEVIERIQRLLDEGILSRFGPMFHAEKLGGGLTLAAIKVSDEDFVRVTEQVNSFSQVAHNYERDHELNMWFVLATECPSEIDAIISDIEVLTGYTVYNMPKQEEFYVGLQLKA